MVFFIFVGGSGKIVLLIMETSNSQLMVICLDNSFKIIDYLSLKVRILYRLMAVFRLRPSCLYGVINIPEIAGAATICTVELLRKRCRACETAGRCNFPDGKIRVCDELSGNLQLVGQNIIFGGYAKLLHKKPIKIGTVDSKEAAHALHADMMSIIVLDIIQCLTQVDILNRCIAFAVCFCEIAKDQIEIS